jgi:hypothetical protein
MFYRRREERSKSCGVQIEESCSPVHINSGSQSECFFDETLENFEYIEDKHEFEEWDLSLNMPGQESILNEENIDILRNELNDWLSARESSQMHVQSYNFVAPVINSEPVPSYENAHLSNEMPDSSLGLRIEPRVKVYNNKAGLTASYVVDKSKAVYNIEADFTVASSTSEQICGIEEDISKANDIVIDTSSKAANNEAASHSTSKKRHSYIHGTANHDSDSRSHDGSWDY